MQRRRSVDSRTQDPRLVHRQSLEGRIQKKEGFYVQGSLEQGDAHTERVRRPLNEKVAETYRLASRSCGECDIGYASQMPNAMTAWSK